VRVTRDQRHFADATRVVTRVALFERVSMERGRSLEEHVDPAEVNFSRNARMLGRLCHRSARGIVTKL
jgi:hypothetical protein